MNKSKWILTLALAVASSTAFARHCPIDMQQIDAALAANPKLSAEQLEEVKKLRADGEAQHKAGDHAASEASLAKAKALLVI